jgi:lipopolysaccharide assembly outer membrane protein LptD (OstA)
MMKSGLITISLFVLLAYSVVAKSPADKWLGNGQDKDATTLEVTAESSTSDQGNDGEVIHYTGRVETRSGDVTIHSERLTVFPKSKKLVADGNVVFSNKEQTIKATSLEWGYGSKPSKITFVF